MQKSQLPSTTSLTGSHRSQNSDSRWHSLTHRDPATHSSFLYGVTSTKIYCRPTCSARLARRANVIFFDTEDEARRDGFRPCKRCKPDDIHSRLEGEDLVTKLLLLLRSGGDTPPRHRRLKELANEVGFTQSYICRVFKKTMGVTVGTYMREFERAEKGMQAGEDAKTSIYDLGETLRSDCYMGESRHPHILAKEDASQPCSTWGRVPSDKGEKEVGCPTIGLDSTNLEFDFDCDFDFDDWLWTEEMIESVPPSFPPKTAAESVSASTTFAATTV